MPPRDPPPGSARDWLRRARADLALARVSLPEGALYEDLCYHCQQAAEMALKAVYVERGLRFGYIHDLGELMRGLDAHGLKVPGRLQEATALTAFAQEARYPGLSEPVRTGEYRHALTQAESVVAWAADVIA